MKGKTVVELIQVSYDISNIETREREIRALKKAMRKLKTNRGTIITHSHRERIEGDGSIVEILPYWEWEALKEPKYFVF